MAEDPRRIIHDVSLTAILKVVAVLVVLAALYAVRDILLVFFVAAILAALIAPFAEAMERRRVPKSVTVLGIYVVLVALLIVLAAAIVPPILEETRDFLGGFSTAWAFFVSKAGALADYTSQRGFDQSLSRSLDSVTAGLPNMALGAFASITGALKSLFSFVLVLVLAFYMVVEAENLKRAIRALTPSRHRSMVISSLVRVQRKLGDWLRAQIILSASVAVLVYLGLLAVGMPYALVLAVLAGLLETVPYAGPVVSAVPAVLLALTVSPIKAALVLAVYVVVQQVESHFLIPKVNQKFVGLNPIVSIMALVLGAEFAGILGAFIAIPIAASITMLVEDRLESRLTEDRDALER